MVNSSDSIVMAIFSLLLVALMLASGVEAQNNTTATYSTPTPTPTPTDSSSSANTLTSTVALFGALIAVSFAMATSAYRCREHLSNPRDFIGCRLFVIKHAIVMCEEEEEKGGSITNHTTTRIKIMDPFAATLAVSCYIYLLPRAPRAILRVGTQPPRGERGSRKKIMKKKEKEKEKW